MALVKTSKIIADAAKNPTAPGNSKRMRRVTPPAPARKSGSDSQQETVLDRLAAATEELASGLGEASDRNNDLDALADGPTDAR